MVGSAVGVTAWITRKITREETEFTNLKDKVQKIEGDITYMFRLEYEDSRKAAATTKCYKWYGTE